MLSTPKPISPHHPLCVIMSEEPVPPSSNANAALAPTAIIGGPPIDVPAWTLPPTIIDGDTHIGDHTIVHAAAEIKVGAKVDAMCTIGPRAEVRARAVLGPGCHVAAEAVIGEGAVLGPGCVVGEECAIGTGAILGPGVVVLALTRLPPKEQKGLPALIGAEARIGGGAVVCGGITVGKGAIVGAGEVVEDDVPDKGVYLGGRVSGEF
jgi:acetyltransferase-like isoleucine patch superfamily enzyme